MTISKTLTLYFLLALSFGVVLPSAAQETNASIEGPLEPIEPFKPQPLPQFEQRTHEECARLKMPPIKLGVLIQVGAMRPLQLDGSRDVPISLDDCIKSTMETGLDVRISKESYVYQKAQLFAQLAGFVPTFALSSVRTKSRVIDPSTSSTSDVFATRLIYPLFQGGGVMQSAIAQIYRTKGWKYTFRTNINSALLNCYNSYMTLCLNHMLLKIRVKAVQVAQEQLNLNEQRFKEGSGTKYDIIQSKSQLASDEQALLAQQVATRQASLSLGYRLNLPLTYNLVPMETELSESKMISEKLSVDEAWATALKSRPELRQYEMFRYAANRSVQAAASSLYPSVSISQSQNNSNTVVDASSSESTQSSGTAGAGIYGGTYNTKQTAVSLSYTLSNMGLGTVANVVGARALSRQALLQANQELMLVEQQVRSDFISFKSARQQIDTAAAAIEASEEALRLAQLRLKVGNGTNLELTQAQNKYFSDLYSKAQAIISSNQAQAQLLHDMGVIDGQNLQGRGL